MRFFDWDAAKGLKNLRKHGVTFAEAQTVFDDPVTRIENDPDHSEIEQREQVIGYSGAGRLLIVSFVQRGQVLRIIRARRVDPSERKRHEEKNF